MLQPNESKTAPEGDTPPPLDLHHLRLPRYEPGKAKARNANTVHKEKLSRIDLAAMWVTDHIGSVGFFLIILVWTMLWTGYNIAASEISGLH